jgi:hypothetical protein
MALHLPRPLHRFARDEGGTILAEFVVALPILLWSYLALFVYWDGYGAINTAQKASYSVADYISRERTTLTPAEIAGLHDVLQFMVAPGEEVKMRLTSIYWDPEDARYEVYWSRSPGNEISELTTDQLQLMQEHIPIMADGDSAVLLETRVSYSPTFDVGVDVDTLENFIVTRPRFLTRICLDGVAC